MASLIMHLTVAQKMINENKIKKDTEYQFLLGTVLPDFCLSANAHYRCSEGGKRFFNISKFREKHLDKIKKDPLYLGYYLHLVQDIIFRDLMYNKYNWDPTIPGNVAKLYGDYRKLNSYLIKKYSLSSDIIKRLDDIYKEALKEFIYEPMYLKDELKKDFSIKEEGDFFFYTPEMTEEFIDKATALCISELLAINNNSGYMNEMEYSMSKIISAMRVLPEL